MQGESDELSVAQTEYLKQLNSVNMLLLKEHTLLLEQRTYQQELTQVEALMDKLKQPRRPHTHLLHAYLQNLHSVILDNKNTIVTLTNKLQPLDTSIKELSAQNQTRKKYEKLIDTDYQNGIQQKLSTIRGKVDDLKKKIKEINKDILSSEQEHAELIDEYSFELNNLKFYRNNNQRLKEEIRLLREQKGRH